MENHFLHIDCSTQTYPKQFIFTEDSDLIPDDWDRHERGKWTLGTSGLPVLDIENSSGQLIGWCVGYGVKDNEMPVSKIAVTTGHNTFIDEDAVEDIYERMGGKYILIVLTKKDERLYLDPYGSLGVVFSPTDQAAASNPNLIRDPYEWDIELIRALDFPKSRLWFPGGLTARKKIRRLLPNHYLDLHNWKVTRHWPEGSGDLSVQEDKLNNIGIIISCLKRTIRNICRRFPIYLCLSAGVDTRTLLACAQDVISHTLFFTFAENKETRDMHIASRLAKKCKLRHFFLPFQHVSEDYMLRWLHITGHSVGVRLSKIYKTLESLDPGRALLNGVGGELGRLFYGRNSDTFDMTLSARELLRRCRFPLNERILSELEEWISGLSGFSPFNVLDLFFIEQVLGCWGGPQHYGNTTSVFELSPFNHRRIFRAMMRLPHTYRLRNQLVGDICRDLWPELLTLPFNEFTGPKYFFYKAKRLGSRITKKTARKIVRA